MRASQLRVMFSNCEIGEEVEGFLKKHGVKVKKIFILLSCYSSVISILLISCAKRLFYYQYYSLSLAFTSSYLLNLVYYKVINDINEPFDCLVMDKFRRRVKLLIALNRKSTLVDAQWLWKSIEEDTIQNPADFALKVSKEDQE